MTSDNNMAKPSCRNSHQNLIKEGVPLLEGYIGEGLRTRCSFIHPNMVHPEI